MPLYEYRCEECNQPFEKLLRFGEEQPSPECPHCHSTKTRKQLSTFATRLSAAGKLSGSSNCGPASSGFR